jgi:DNA (cytosine-5)-methyltransferase 1
MKGIIAVLFAGFGGADKGIEAATGRKVDVAINHSPVAIATHRINFPTATHFTTDVWDVEPVEATQGRPVDILWASPDCTHFSVAKGGKPKDQGIRSLAWVVVAWASRTKPRRIFMENVREIEGWGPLYEERHVTARESGLVWVTGRSRPMTEAEWAELIGTPIPERKGETFQKFVGQLRDLGYRVEWRVLNACEYGAPTARRRLFLVAARDGEAIHWPKKTHGPGLLPFNTAASCIDWEIPCPSIFERSRPLVEKTLWRIAEGLRRFVFENPEPFIVGCGGRAGQTPPTGMSVPMGTITAKNDRALVVPSIIKVNHGGEAARGEPIDAPMSTVTAQRRGHAVVMPTLIQTGYGERQGQAARTLDLHQPLGTVMAQGQKHALVSAFIAKHFGGVVGVPLDGRPLDTVKARDSQALVTASLGGRDHTAEVRAFLTSYYGEDATSGQRVDRPLRTITAKARMGLVTVAGVDHQIVDIGMRMLEPHELLRAQFGRFASSHDMSAAKSKADQVRLIGNSVCPEVAEALVRANVSDDVNAREAA